jgi:hypothetical protein
MKNVGGLRDCGTRKGSLLEDAELPVFTTRARSVAKVLAAPATRGAGGSAQARSRAGGRSANVSEWVWAVYGHVEG